MKTRIRELTEPEKLSLGEFQHFKSLTTETYPTGIVSIVSDTWDLFRVLTDYLPRLKEEIMAREGKVVIRPDSGDPVDIICGNLIHGSRSPEGKGVIELLWDTFGGTVNSKGYKQLDEHIGAIYGDSITPERAKEILKRLEAKGFASTNIVFGIGSYTYQYVTRDTLGLAMKATYGAVNGEGREIFKDPITDSGIKKSARGLLRVKDGKLFDQQEDINDLGDMQVVFQNGRAMNIQTFEEIRGRLK